MKRSVNSKLENHFKEILFFFGNNQRMITTTHSPYSTLHTSIRHWRFLIGILKFVLFINKPLVPSHRTMFS